MPISSCSLRLDNEDVRVAVGLRLGTALCKPHLCPCGAMVDVSGTHGLSCKKGQGKYARHSFINDIICRSLARADIQCVKEPAGLSRLDGKRPDGLTLIPWKLGKCAVWDVTIADTTAISYSSVSSLSAGNVAELAANKKHGKYTDLAKTHHFVPIAMESLGPFCSEAVTFLKELGRRMTMATADVRETSHLFQRLSVAIQHYNRVLFRSSFISDVFDDDNYI